METLEVSALEGPTLAVAEGLSMTSLFEHSVAEPTEYSCLMMTDCDDLSKSLVSVRLWNFKDGGS